MDWRVAQQSHNIEGDDANNEVHPHPPQGRPNPQPHHQNTYIVQFPREQVYYVPPPEHAEFIQRQRNNISPPNHPKSSNSSTTCCPRPNFIIALIFFCLVAIVAIAIFVLYFLYKPTFPSFSVSSMSLVTTHNNNNHSHHLYKITLTAINPNAGSSVLYHNDAHVSLLSGNKALVGKGQFLGFQQQPDSSSSVNVEVKGVDDKTMETNEDDKKSVAFVLEMRDIRVNTLLGGFNFWTMQCNVDCDFKVNSLTKQTRVLSQQCTTNS